MSHTPGPWKATRVNGGWAITANLGPHNMEKDVALCDVKEKNANLIASAPDLLALLREGVALHREAHVTGSSACDFEVRARAVIAKARGEA